MQGSLPFGQFFDLLFQITGLLIQVPLPLIFFGVVLLLYYTFARRFFEPGESKNRRFSPNAAPRNYARYAGAAFVVILLCALLIPEVESIRTATDSLRFGALVLLGAAASLVFFAALLFYRQAA